MGVNINILAMNITAPASKSNSLLMSYITHNHRPGPPKSMDRVWGSHLRVFGFAAVNPAPVHVKINPADMVAQWVCRAERQGWPTCGLSPIQPKSAGKINNGGK